jgi:hypothetical protein
MHLHYTYQPVINQSPTPSHSMVLKKWFGDGTLSGVFIGAVGTGICLLVSKRLMHQPVKDLAETSTWKKGEADLLPTIQNDPTVFVNTKEKIIRYTNSLTGKPD